MKPVCSHWESLGSNPGRETVLQEIYIFETYAMKTTIKNIFVKCPCCQQMKGGNQLHHLEKWQKQYGFQLHEKRLENPETSSLFWVCDRCLKKERAFMANPKRQNTGAFSYPFFAYFDREKTCEDCQTHFVFSKEEQQFWYERLGFSIFSDAKRCLACRKKRRNPAKQQISNLVPRLNPKNLNDVEKLVLLYLEIGNVEKAKYYLVMARKAIATSKTDKKLAQVEAINGIIKDYEKNLG